MRISIDNVEHYTWGTGCDGWHLLKSDSLSVIQERMPHGSKEITHFHTRSQQLFYILRGVATFKIGKEITILNPGECIHVPRGKTHSIRNEGIKALEFIVISEPMAHGDRTNMDSV